MSTTGIPSPRDLRAATVTATGAVAPLPWLATATLTWPLADAPWVLRGWREWLDAEPVPAASSVRLRRPARGRATVAVEVALPGPSHGPLTALRALSPETETIALAGHDALRPGVAVVPPGFVALRAHVRLRGLPAEAVGAFVAAAGPHAALEVLSAELHQLGGTYALAAVAAARTGDDADRARIALAQLERRLAPWAA